MADEREIKERDKRKQKEKRKRTERKKTRLFTYYSLAGIPGVTRDEKLRKQIFEITWRDKGWIG
jgi:hypothetical protein